jgi:hypothetical protein
VGQALDIDGAWRELSEIQRAQERWEKNRKGKGQVAGWARLLDVESDGGSVHAPFPKRRDAKPRGANRRTEIIYFKSAQQA